MKKRLITIVSIFCVCATGSYFLFKPDTHSYADQALNDIREDRFAAAESALRTLSPQQMAVPVALYKGYLEQARGRYLESNLYFQSLLKEQPRKLKEAILTEAMLGQAANAYFEQRDWEFSPLLATASQGGAHTPFLVFFEGLRNYLSAEYGQALKAWSTFSIPESSEGSGWMGAMVEKLFPLSWRQLHVAHCLTEEGDLLTGREMLERESHQMENQELGNLATLFLGLTYLKEAEHIPLDQRGSYYKLARFYFERSGSQERFQRERTLITPHLLREAESLLTTNLDSEKQRWGFDFVHTLQDWKEDGAVRTLADGLAANLLKHRDEEFCFALRQEFLGSPFHTLLTQNLVDSIADGLKRGKTDDLFELWGLVEQLSPTPKLLAKEIASLTSEEIFRTIKQDGHNLVHTRRYLAFWETLGRSNAERERLARSLFAHAKVIWQQESHEKKAERLTDLSLNLCVNRGGMENQIAGFLTSLYNSAEESNLIGRLMQIFDAMDHFHINKQELATPGKMANHLADAEYLYHAHNYSLSKAHALWVLKLDPQNQDAQRLVGLSSFHLGEYTRALCSLEKLESLDEDTQKALMLSQVFASQEQERHLVQIDTLDAFDEEDVSD